MQQRQTVKQYDDERFKPVDNKNDDSQQTQNTPL